MQPRISIELIENDKEGKSISLKSEIAAKRFHDQLAHFSIIWKRKLGRREDPLDIYSFGDVVSISARGVTGIFSIGNHDVTIIPKYLSTDPNRRMQWGAALIGMLTTIDPRHFLILGEVGTSRAPIRGFIDLIAYAFVKNLTRAFDEGIPKAYVRTQKCEPVLRGRIIPDKIYPQVLVTPHEIPCEYSTYHPNSVVARLLKWATNELRILTGTASIISQLDFMLSRMSSISTQLPSLLMLDRISLGPQYRHIEPAFMIAKWLAKAKGGQYGSGASILPGILLNSDRVFEDFVLACLRRVCRLNRWRFKRSVLSMALPIGAGGRIRTEPDGQIFIDDRISLVLDAKYKKWGTNVRAVNAYQVMAGARVMGCERGVLIYPTPSNSTQRPATWLVQGDGNPTLLSAVFIDPICMGQEVGLSVITEKLSDDLDEILRTTI